MANVKLLGEAKKYFNDNGCYLIIKHVFDMDENVVRICISVEKDDRTWFTRTYSVKPEYCDKSKTAFRTLTDVALYSEKDDTLLLAERLSKKCERLLG